MSAESPQNGLGIVSPGSEPENVSESQCARKAAALWLNEAMKTVETVFPSVRWGTDIDPALSDEFDAAIEARFYLNTMDEETFRGVWRRWYGAHL